MVEIRNADFWLRQSVRWGWPGAYAPALLHCRRTGRGDVSQLVVDLNEIGNRLTRIEDVLRNIYREVQG